MTILYIGLGKMGIGMVSRLVENGHEIIAYDQNETARKAAEIAGAKSVSSPTALMRAAETPRLLWLMVPHQVVDTVLDEIVPHLNGGDTVIDGGNSFFKDSIRRSEVLAQKKIRFIDAGVSGGPHGARNGACIMVGGESAVVAQYAELFGDITAPNAFQHVGPIGAGHFVKMVHNGIEYGMMQSIAEGFTLLEHSDFNLNLEQVANLYNHQSVVESRLIGWLNDSFKKFGQELDNDECCSGTVGASGEGQWTVDTAREMNVPVTAIEDALTFRKESEKKPSYTGRLLSAMRNAFGGHAAPQDTKK